jgi:hypothetical protein
MFKADVLRAARLNETALTGEDVQYLQNQVTIIHFSIITYSLR